MERRATHPWERRPRCAAAAAVAALLLFGAACGGGEDAAGPSATAAPVGPTAATQPALTSLSGTATCGDYVRATQAARENATRAALIVFRNGAGVEREPSPEVREEFEVAVVEVCRGRPSAGMLDAMSAVAEVGQGTYLR